MATLKESRDATTGQAHPPSRGADEPKDRPSRGPSRLEGSPLGRFEGDGGESLQFLTQFNLFMMMNQRVTIASNPMRRSAYLSLVRGPKVESWAEKSYDWLDRIEADPPRHATPRKDSSASVKSGSPSRVRQSQSRRARPRARRTEKVENDGRTRGRVYRRIRKALRIAPGSTWMAPPPC